VKKLIYLTIARLPTEKAHGYQISKMCEAFAQQGVEVTLMHPARRQPTPKLAQSNVFDYYGIKPSFTVKTLPNLDVVAWRQWIPNPFFTPIFFAHALAWGLYAALVASRYGAELYFTRNIEIAFWLTKLNLPTAYEAHFIPKRIRRRLLRNVASSTQCKLLIALTSHIQNRLIGMGCPSDKITVLPDGVDQAMFQHLPPQEECRRRLGLPLGKPIIGYIGRFVILDMEKGLSNLIQALAYIPESELLLVCVGGPMEVVPFYLDTAHQFGIPEHRLKFVDRVPNLEVPYWIRSLDVAVIPYPRTEYLSYFVSPLKLFEYMAAGVPIVASDLPSLREILHHKENAWLVPPENPQALAEGIYTLLKDRDLAKKLASRALDEVKRYTWNARAEKILRRAGLEG